MFQASDQYKTNKLLGKGGFGEALLVDGLLSSDPRKQYVIKRYNLDALSSRGQDESEQKKLVNMAFQEAELMKSLDQPNIVKVFSSFQEGSLLHIVMEYCDSGTLKDAIRGQNGTFFQEANILLWTAQLAMTLKYLHNRNILHRDIKSENIFLASGGRVLKLGDFGISKIIDGHASSRGLVLATFTHLAPEVRLGNPYVFKSEVWALGIVVYELMALKLPFQAYSNFKDVNVATLFNAVSTLPIKLLPETFSVELRQLVFKMLRRDAEKRPEMADIICHPCILSTLIDNVTAYQQLSS